MLKKEEEWERNITKRAYKKEIKKNRNKNKTEKEQNSEGKSLTVLAYFCFTIAIQSSSNVHFFPFTLINN